MPGRFVKSGVDFWLVSGRLQDSFGAPATATSSGKMTKLTMGANLGLLSFPAAGTAGSVASSFGSGEWAEWRFQYTDDSFQELMAFSTHSIYMAGASDFPTVIDILEDNDNGVVLTSLTYPRRVATSYGDAEFDPYGSAGLPNDGVIDNGTCIYGWQPSAYTDSFGSPYGTGTYRVRVRGVPRRHPWLAFPVGQGGAFTLKYWMLEADLRARIRYWPECPAVGDTVSFKAEVYGADDPPDEYEWNFGDAGTDSGSSVSHAYATDGFFIVSLTIQNTGGIGTFTTRLHLAVIPTDVKPIRVFSPAKAP